METPIEVPRGQNISHIENKNIDPKVQAMNIISELDKKNLVGNQKKKGLGPAETGSLLKHKEIQQTKYISKNYSNYVDFDSSDSSLGSFEGTCI